MKGHFGQRKQGNGMTQTGGTAKQGRGSPGWRGALTVQGRQDGGTAGRRAPRVSPRSRLETEAGEGRSVVEARARGS